MSVFTRTRTYQTRGPCEVVDVTADVRAVIREAGIREGRVLVFVPGSTAAVTTIEFEPGLRQDLPELFERLIPSDESYHHDRTWQDGNGYAHLRAALVGPSVFIPVQNGEPLLGQWQQVVLVEFDNRSRQRRLIIQAEGERFE